MVSWTLENPTSPWGEGDYKALMEDKLSLCSALTSVQFNRCGRGGGVVLYRAVGPVVKHTVGRDMVRNIVSIHFWLSCRHVRKLFLENILHCLKYRSQRSNLIFHHPSWSDYISHHSANTVLPNTVRLACCKWRHFWLGGTLFYYSPFILAHLCCNCIPIRSGITTYRILCLGVSEN